LRCFASDAIDASSSCEERIITSHSSDVFGLRLRPHALADEIGAVGVVHDAIEDGVGIGGISDQLVPFVDRDLTGDGRPATIVFFDDLKKILASRHQAAEVPNRRVQAIARHQGSAGCGHSGRLRDRSRERGHSNERSDAIQWTWSRSKQITLGDRMKLLSAAICAIGCDWG
jgi:hypothetical protein